MEINMTVKRRLYMKLSTQAEEIGMQIGPYCAQIVEQYVEAADTRASQPANTKAVDEYTEPEKMEDSDLQPEETEIDDIEEETPEDAD